MLPPRRGRGRAGREGRHERRGPPPPPQRDRPVALGRWPGASVYRRAEPPPTCAAQAASIPSSPQEKRIASTMTAAIRPASATTTSSSREMLPPRVTRQTKTPATPSRQAWTERQSRCAQRWPGPSPARAGNRPPPEPCPPRSRHRTLSPRALTRLAAAAVSGTRAPDGALRMPATTLHPGLAAPAPPIPAPCLIDRHDRQQEGGGHDRGDGGPGPGGDRRLRPRGGASSLACSASSARAATTTSTSSPSGAGGGASSRAAAPPHPPKLIRSCGLAPGRCARSSAATRRRREECAAQA